MLKTRLLWIFFFIAVFIVYPSTCADKELGCANIEKGLKIVPWCLFACNTYPSLSLNQSPSCNGTRCTCYDEDNGQDYEYVGFNLPKENCGGDSRNYSRKEDTYRDKFEKNCKTMCSDFEKSDTTLDKSLFIYFNCAQSKYYSMKSIDKSSDINGVCVCINLNRDY